MTRAYPNRRRRDPAPMARAGELAFVLITAMVYAMAVAALVGVGIAGALYGDGWVWPRGTMISAVAGLLDGDPRHGYTPSAAARLPSDSVVYACVAAAVFVVIAVAIAMLIVATRFWRIGDARGGLASRSDARRVLGRSRLRRDRALIRPDLFSGRGTGEFR